jgi:quercetin dioxygenase-like cupin family protein
VVTDVHEATGTVYLRDRLCIFGQRLASTASPDRKVVELRRGGQALAGSYLYEGDGLITGWHSHEVHQIEYALHGIVDVETDSAHYPLPPQQAAWIPVGLEHQTVTNPDVKTVAVMFDPALIPDARGAGGSSPCHR